METDDFRSLLTWFRELADEIRNTGTPAEITSGLACVHHRLAEVTKDCDIWIPPTSLTVFKHLVLTRPWQGNHAVYRSALSVPLDARWLNGGWSAHIVWEGRPKAQVDVFGRMPRILEHTGGDVYSDEETLARVKMTRREKDWPTVHALGERLIINGNPKGLLFLQKAESLFAAKERFSQEQWAVQAKDRPLLDCFDGAIQVTMLAAHLRTEQTFWRQVDHHRMENYRDAGKNYAKAAHKILNTVAIFTEQDAARRLSGANKRNRGTGNGPLGGTLVWTAPVVFRRSGRSFAGGNSASQSPRGHSCVAFHAAKYQRSAAHTQ